ncbi:YncE family protein [Streptomyces albus subsp. chlorinus]|uniref:YncE family protein n=1 Tax=Streptomyces albus TaxID=1888 RepID=UPI00157066EC|nr:YncE family protein [Streptomyces albus]NSC20210.1 YncE family protein [Streptomyces albus subsp. chlorinus]
MSTLTCRIRRSAALAVALAAGSTLAPAATATAQPAPRTGPAVTTAPLAAGLYQSAYSERNRVLWATAAVGRPPVTDSALLRVDPRTLKVRSAHRPPVTDPETGAVEAVYGVAVDDEHNTVWTTNTRDDSVAVYSQRDGRHLTTLHGVAHAREIVVDERHGTAWAGGFGDGTLVAFDTRTREETKRVTVAGASPAGLAVNERTGTVYATDLAGDRIIALSPHAKAPKFLPAGDGPISVALSPDGRTAYTANQAAGTVSVVNLRKGRVTRTVPTGEGALSVATDPRSGRVLAANRTAGDLTVIDPRRGTVVERLAAGPHPNHVTVSRGTAYVVDKSKAGPRGEDQVHRLRLRR